MKNYYLDLFHGIGGFALGANWSGMKFDDHFCSDIDDYCKELYKLRFPDSIQLGDIEKIDFEKLPKGNWIINGGFPCQDISIAGKQKGLLDEKGNKTRSGLWFDYKESIRILQPKFVIIENVRGILRIGLDQVLSDLAEIGYNAEWQIISAKQLGAMHQRERIFIITYPKSIGWVYYNRSIEDKTFEKYKVSRSKGYTSLLLHEKTQYEIKSNDERIYNGIPNEMDRFKGCGNAIIPQIAHFLFDLIKENYYREK